MRFIKLTRNKSAIVDDEDFFFLNQFKWYILQVDNCFYAARLESKGKILLMHRVILKAKGSERIDHRNRDGLDNRKCNLRIASASQNMANRGIPKNNTAGFKGVWFNKMRKNWRAAVKLDGRRINLGSFRRKKDAARAYDEAALRIFGEFAVTNKSLGLLN